MGSSLAPDTPGTLGRRQLRARLHAVAQDSPLHTPTLASVSSGEPGTGPYLMELSDETSRSESSVSLGGGGGSLTGTAVKAGDFLEKNSRCHLGTSKKKKKNTRCHLGASRKPKEACVLSSSWPIFWEAAAGCQAGKWG